jgi:hypothetical protein
VRDRSDEDQPVAVCRIADVTGAVTLFAARGFALRETDEAMARRSAADRSSLGAAVLDTVDAARAVG